MSFLDRARQAAEQARQAAAERAHQAQVKFQEQAPIIQAQTREGLGIAGANIKVGAKQAKKSAASIVDRMDPGILADIVIKATALQERANASLRAKGSPYRIGEITITAALPPQLGFTIARIGDVEEELTGREIESAELAATVATEEFSLLPSDGEPIEGHETMAEAAGSMPPDDGTGGGQAIGAGDAVVGWTAPVAAPDDRATAGLSEAPTGGTGGLAPDAGTGQPAPRPDEQLAGGGVPAGEDGHPHDPVP